MSSSIQEKLFRSTLTTNMKNSLPMKHIELNNLFYIQTNKIYENNAKNK